MSLQRGAEAAFRSAGAARPSVSVVVATCRRDHLLRRCLRALVDQRFHGSYEIIVVDDACSPTTQGVIDSVASARDDVGITLLQGLRRGPASARNIGWRYSLGEIIAFTDDDAYPADETWLARGFAWFDNPNVTAATGAVSVPAGEPPTDFQRNVKALEKGEFLTCNVFYRRTALEQAGGFDERFTVPFREDSDLQYRVEALGGTMIKDPGLRVVHPASPGRFAVSLRLQRYSQFNALIYKKHPERFRTRLQPQPPLLYYAIVTAGGLALAAGLTRRPRSATLLAFVWAALEGRFFLRRARGVSHSPKHLADLALTSLLIPPLSIFWRIRGAIRFRVFFF